MNYFIKIGEECGGWGNNPTLDGTRLLVRRRVRGKSLEGRPKRKQAVIGKELKG